jgi:IS30 family transposase
VIVDLKERIGDWEIDTIHGHRQGGAVVSIVDRKAKLTRLKRVMDRQADTVAHATIEMLAGLGPLTITGDNGKEFASHELISEMLGADFYFAHPYSSWERGLNENTNGLVRQYFPKGTNFKEIEDWEVQWVEDRLNNRPRKTLGYATPNEVFHGLRE